MATNDSINISSSGYISHNGSGTFSGRTITGTSNQITVSNGSGVSGNTNLSLPSNIYVSGISFDSGTNIMSNYVSTTWTPAVAGSVTAGTGVYTSQLGTYVRIGNFVFLEWELNFSSHTGTGDYRIINLPVTANSGVNFYNEAAISSLDWPASTTEIKVVIIGGNSFINVMACGSGTSSSAVQMQNKTVSCRASINFFV